MDKLIECASLTQRRQIKSKEVKKGSTRERVEEKEGESEREQQRERVGTTMEATLAI